jgi:hypothetical protein
MRPHLYFAYGANMDGALLAARLGRPDPAVFRRRRGLLADHALVFDKLAASEPGVGYANLSPSPGESVEGVLNELDDEDLLRLDRIELVPIHYTRRTAAVLDPATHSVIAAEAYWAVPERVRPGLLPRRDYMERLLRGADVLSPGYVESLRRLRAVDGALVPSR